MRKTIKEISRRSFFITSCKTVTIFFASMAVAVKTIENEPEAKNKRNANKWVEVKAEEIKKMQGRRKALAQMSLEKRNDLRQHFIKYEKLPKLKKLLIQSNQKEYIALPIKLKKELETNERRFHGLQIHEKEAVEIKFKKWIALSFEQQQQIEKSIKEKT